MDKPRSTAAGSKLHAALKYSSSNGSLATAGPPHASGGAARLGHMAADIAAAVSDPQRPCYVGSLSQQRMAAMDAHARACPASETRTIASLAAFLGSAARNAEEKVRAISFWLHLNVRYNTEAYFSGNIANMSADDVLRERSSVCHGFARLMSALCTACGVECKVIDGYAKGYSYQTDARGAETMPYKSNHNWNAVKLYSPSARHESWFLIDPTWCAGGTKVQDRKWHAEWNPAYYMVDPLAFAQSHFPSDPTWALLPESQRPSWSTFVASVRLHFPVCWELGIVPVTHKRETLSAAAVEEDGGRLRVVLRRRKGAFMLASANDGPHVYPSLLPSGSSGSELVAFEFKGLRVPPGGSGGGSSGGGGDVTLHFFASQHQYSTYALALQYVMRAERKGESAARGAPSP